ncbi:MAG TPA: hypothetical protein VGE01_08835 [Fimbriimonas sp.]
MIRNGKYVNEPTFRGKKVVIWVIALFFALSIIGPLSAILFSRILSPYLMEKDREAAKQAAIERMEQRDSQR